MIKRGRGEAPTKLDSTWGGGGGGLPQNLILHRKRSRTPSVSKAVTVRDVPVQTSKESRRQKGPKIDNPLDCKANPLVSSLHPQLQYGRHGRSLP